MEKGPPVFVYCCVLYKESVEYAYGTINNVMLPEIRKKKPFVLSLQPLRMKSRML
jgi:hypothetical protein